MATSSPKKQFTADFFCFTKEGESHSTFLADLLETHAGRHAPAHELVPKSEELFQIRSIKKFAGGNIFGAVFGRCKFGAKPEQAATDSEGEEDVDLKPGHGLVEKNHFLFFKDLNLVVFQRNGNAGRYTHLQSYLNMPNFEGYTLLPVLTKDSYSKIENGGPLKRIEISVMQAARSLDPETSYLKHYIEMLKGSNAGRMKIILSCSTGGTLNPDVKTAFLKLARFGRAKVAKATLADDNELIDLIADRITHPMMVDLLPNKRPDPQSMFAELAAAKDAHATDLQRYFGP